ncbi:MAG: extracellular solute-binding protein [Hyphomicrobiaceae bacterium]
MSRRIVSAMAGCTTAFLATAFAATAEPRHGLSAFGALKYAPDFQHFEYVNPNAPKGGRFTHVGSGGTLTFDNLNPFILKGDAAQGVETLVFESLMVRAQDEPDSVYGLIAASADLAADRRSVTFTLRPQARFADGTTITSKDVCFSYRTLKEQGHPVYRSILRDVERCETPSRSTVRYAFKGEQIRDLPIAVAELPVLSSAYYAKVRFDETTLVPPLGSGPYRIGEFNQGAFISYRRRPDYWAKDLPVNRGRFNFDEIRYEYFRDRTASLESFKAGAYDFREEFTSRDWATAYDIPQVRDGRIVRLVLPDASPSGAQGFFINTRRPHLMDRRVRHALDLAFDFEWMNKHLFYGLYERTWSYFENSDLKAEGTPSPAELALLQPFRGKLPAEAFGEPYSPPVSDGSGRDRKRLREAAKLLAAAGWSLRTGNMLTNAGGKTLDIEFLSNEPTMERIIGPYVGSLRLLGINASIRRVDTAQYERRVKSFDFDIVTQRYIMRLTPGPELFNYFSSQSAKMSGSYNLSGIADPAVDTLVGKVQEAKSRADLLTATRALDRVLRAGHYWVPHWYKASHALAFWDKFGRPPVKPKYARGVIDTWWYDTAKAARLAAGGGAKPN